MGSLMLDWIWISKFSLLIWVSNLSNLSGLNNGDRDIGCFSDCYKHGQTYTGIRSVLRNEQICKYWKDTRFAARKELKGNLCSSLGETRPKCITPNDYEDYCEVPDCSTSTGCVHIVNKEQDFQSVKIKWLQPPNLGTIQGYLVLLHNDSVCQRAIIQLCDNCGSMERLGKEIRSLYRSCKILDEEYPIRNEAKFSDLKISIRYNVYIAPIISSSSVGDIRDVMVRITSLDKPHVPIGVTYQLDTIRNIKFSWEKNVETVIYGLAEGYVAIITNRNTGSRVRKIINTESVEYNDVEICTEYCFGLSSYNRAGESGYTKEICAFTLAPKPERTELADPPSGYMRSQSLSWTYLGSDNCRQVYRVEYWVKFLEQSTLNSTIRNGSSILLTDLKPNVIYTVRVQAQAQMKTVNNEIFGGFSSNKEFYTGKLQPSLLYYEQTLGNHKRTLNISWGIEEEMRWTIFIFIIQVKNVMNSCLYSVLLTLRTCREPWCWKNLNPKDQDSLNKMKCKPSLFDKIDGDQTIFNYTINSEKEFTNFSVEIFGFNLWGIHTLKERSTIIPTPGTSYVVLISWITVIIAVLVLVFFVSIVIGLRFKKKTVKVEEPYILNRIQKLEKLKTKIMISAFPSYYQKVSKYGGAQLIKQYKKLTKAAQNQEVTLRLTDFEGKEFANLNKNQFVHIVPYDQNRVKVGPKGPLLDYINASYIPYENEERQIEYIAAQGPIESTLSDFWQMIWEQNIHHIVMLSRRREKSRFQCLQYWPDDAENSVSYGNHSQFEVSLVRVVINEVYIERELKVENTISKQCRNLIQLHMCSWSDHSAPNLDYLRKFFFKFHEITNGDAQNPYLVHCIDGVGATGTFICIDRIIKQLVSGIQMISIFGTVLKLREYRKFMVQQQGQYIFIHKYLDYFLEKYMRIEQVNDQGYDY